MKTENPLKIKEKSRVRKSHSAFKLFQILESLRLRNLVASALDDIVATVY